MNGTIMDSNELPPFPAPERYTPPDGLTQMERARWYYDHHEDMGRCAAECLAASRARGWTK